MAARNVLLFGEDRLALAGLEKLLEAYEDWRVAGTILLPLDEEAFAREEADAGLWDLGVQGASDPLWFPEHFPAGVSATLGAPDEIEALDAYSRTVTRVAEEKCDPDRLDGGRLARSYAAACSSAPSRPCSSTCKGTFFRSQMSPSFDRIRRL